MFDKEYTFRGTHAFKVKRMTSVFDKDNNSIFKRNYDVYALAPIVGFLYGKRSPINRENDEKTDIFPDILILNKTELMFNYRLIMLLDAGHSDNFEERMNKAFRDYGTEKTKRDEERYDEYVRGGVDVLYEKIMETATTAESYLSNLYDFLEEFDERYKEISDDSIKALCQLAKI